ncbi:hypothetical protein [Pseudomonas guariconensis]|uniref:hypothetical protein n=1 Tax=Pseudomonas guariconensis TaxID=1288410 RepID=UPI003905A846
MKTLLLAVALSVLPTTGHAASQPIELLSAHSFAAGQSTADYSPGRIKLDVQITNAGQQVASYTSVLDPMGHSRFKLDQTPGKSDSKELKPAKAGNEVKEKDAGGSVRLDLHAVPLEDGKIVLTFEFETNEQTVGADSMPANESSRTAPRRRESSFSSSFVSGMGEPTEMRLGSWSVKVTANRT